MRRPRPLLSLLALAGAIATGATAATSADPGITTKTILVGGTTPLSGTESAYASVARGANAYFKYVNSRGGVNGRTITYKDIDDGYDPAQTVQATQQLVEQDKVFAIFNSLGTEHNLATRDYLNDTKVPQLFVGSGATTFGRDFKQYPWTIGFQPSYRAEGWIYGKYLARTRPARQGRRPLPERRLRQGSAGGPEAGDRALEGEGRRGAAVRGHRRGRAVADLAAEGLGRGRARALRDPRPRDPGLRLRERARLAAADHQQRRLERLEHHDPRLRGRLEQGRRELDLDRLPQGSDRREVAERRRGEALPLDHVPLREGREPEGRLPRLRHGGRLRVREGAEGGRQEPDPRLGDGCRRGS